MTWSQQNGGDVSQILRSEYEQLNTPSRSQMLTASAVEFPNNETQQGTAALNAVPGIAGLPTAAIQVARWW
jgi:hypothetical protein